MAKHFKDFVTDAKERVREIHPPEVRAKLEAEANFTLVDVREDGEWAAGHLPGAIHLGRGVIERDAHKLLPDPDAEIVLYCGGGSRSALAADTLQQMGYKRVLSMAEGFGGWRNAGYEIVTD